MRVLLLPALALLGTCFVSQVVAHVALMDPPARNVLWRTGFPNVPKHEDDDYLLCQEEDKKCPPCGDSPHSPKPLPHQAGGEWALGIISRNYTMGETIDVEVSVTNSHGGHMEFKLCPNNNVKKAVKQRCLDRYPLEVVGYPDGKVPVSAPYQSKQEIKAKVVLPKGIECDQCVLQMSQYAEQFKPSKVMFRNCADIGISDSRSSGSSKSSSSSSSSSSRGSGRKPTDSVFGTSPSYRSSSQSSRQTVFIDQSASLGGISLSNLGGPSPSIQVSSKRSPSFSQVQVPFQQQVVSSAPFTSSFTQPQQQQLSPSGFGGSHLAPQKFTSTKVQNQQFQPQRQQYQQQQNQQPRQQQRFHSQQPQPILHSFQPDFNSNKQTSPSFAPNQQFQNARRPQFQNVHQQPTPVAFSPSQVVPRPQKFEPHQVVTYSQPQPFLSSTNFGSQFSGQQSDKFARSSDSSATQKNRGFSGFGGTGSESAFQTRSKSMFPVDRPQNHGGFGSSVNFGRS